MNGLILGLTLPVLGTTAGAACVFILHKRLNERLNKLLLGFAAGVMVAASVWSLLIPAMETDTLTGGWRVLPVLIGFLAGMALLLLIDVITPHLHQGGKREGPRSSLSRNKMLFLAVTIHNIPEGLAVGVSLAGALTAHAYMPIAAALALSTGIAIQNFPEGAIVSLPLATNGNRTKAFWFGTLSGIVEPIAAIVTILLAEMVLPAMPYMLSFAAGAMLYVVVEDLIPQASEGSHSNLGTIGFAIGFAVMMVLDVVLG